MHVTLIPVIILIAGLALARIVLFVKTDTGYKESIIMLWMAAGLGAIALNASQILEFLIIPQNIIFALKDGSATLMQNIFASSSIAVIEELAKFLPLMLLIKNRKFFNEMTDGVIYFAIAGQTFGLLEDIAYTMSSGTEAGLLRLIFTPFFHLATTGIIGYYLARHKIFKKPLWTVALSVIAMIVVHFVYDFGLFSGQSTLTFVSLSITIILAIAVIIYLLVAHNTDKKLGLAD